MIAGLPMYDWPERRAENDALWQRLRAALAGEGVDAPATLTRGGDPMDLWLAPDLLVAQTCSHPLATTLAGRVAYVATPSHDAPGCDRPGHYRSVIIRRGRHAHLPPPATPGAVLAGWSPGERIALNGEDSMSGWHALLRDAAKAGRALPERRLVTGAHRASIISVADGTADIAAIDCVSWRLALAHEPAAKAVHVAGWTALRPGLPLVTRRDAPAGEIAALRRAAAGVMNAVVLETPIDA